MGKYEGFEKEKLQNYIQYANWLSSKTVLIDLKELHKKLSNSFVAIKLLDDVCDIMEKMNLKVERLQKETDNVFKELEKDLME